MVTRRLRPLKSSGRRVHQIGMPFHWGYAGETVGGNANDLTSLVADPNVSMHEGKVFACEVEAGRLPAAADPTARPPESPIPRPVPRHAAGGAAGGEARPWEVESWRSSTCRRPPIPRRGRLAQRARGAAASARSAAANRPTPHQAMGFFTDTTLCIGCKACEVACKQWNQLPSDGFHWTGNSYDNTEAPLRDLVAAREVHRAVRDRCGVRRQVRRTTA